MSALHFASNLRQLAKRLSYHLVTIKYNRACDAAASLCHRSSPFLHPSIHLARRLDRALRAHCLHDARAHLPHSPLRGSLPVRLGDGPDRSRAGDWLRLCRSIQRPHGADRVGYAGLSAHHRRYLQAGRRLHSALRLAAAGHQLGALGADRAQHLGDRLPLLRPGGGALVGVAMGPLPGGHAVRGSLGVGDDADRLPFHLGAGSRLAHARRWRSLPRPTK